MHETDRLTELRDAVASVLGSDEDMEQLALVTRCQLRRLCADLVWDLDWRMDSPAAVSL